MGVVIIMAVMNNASWSFLLLLFRLICCNSVGVVPVLVAAAATTQTEDAATRTEDYDKMEISYVLEPFESISHHGAGVGWYNETTASSISDGTDHHHHRTNNSSNTATMPMNELTLTTTEDEDAAALFGRAALRAEYRVEEGRSVDFGRVLSRGDGVHDCFGAAHFSLWYGMMVPPSDPLLLPTGGGGAHDHYLRLVLMDDDGFDDNDNDKDEGDDVDLTRGEHLEHFVSLQHILAPPNNTTNNSNSSKSSFSGHDNNNATSDTAAIEWRELRIRPDEFWPAKEVQRQQRNGGSSSSAAAFQMSSSTQGRRGNGKLDLRRIRGWRIEIGVVADPTIVGGGDRDDEDAVAAAAVFASNGNSSSRGVVLFDQLSCVGGGDMLGAPFYYRNNNKPREEESNSDNDNKNKSKEGDDNNRWEDSLADGIWSEDYFQSDLSKNRSRVGLLDNNGTLTVNYTVQMVESWGGYTSYRHFAPGPGYYNLSSSMATNLNLRLQYNVKQAAVPSGRTHLRIILEESSDGNHSDDGSHERWYSFNYVLDQEGPGEIVIPFNGSHSDPSSPFWLTGWSGQMGNSQLDVSHIKGYTIEFNIDSLGAMNSTSTGIVELFNLTAEAAASESSLATESTEQPAEERTHDDDHRDGTSSSSSSSDAASRCVAEPDLHLSEFPGLFQTKEFQGSSCCRVCQEDPSCLYAVSRGAHCYVASHVETYAVSVMHRGDYNVASQRERRTSYWMDDADKRGDYCTKCDCDESTRTIDCRGRDLLILPKTMTSAPSSSSWTPRFLDLRQNPRLVVLGAGALKEISESLQEIWLPANMSHVSPACLEALPLLRAVHLEEDDDEQRHVDDGDDDGSSSRLAIVAPAEERDEDGDGGSSNNGNAVGGGQERLRNFITDPSDAFGDVCCSRGAQISLLSSSSSSSSSSSLLPNDYNNNDRVLTFCNLTTEKPGSDAEYQPFVRYPHATPTKILRPSSPFMFEAAESVEKCAEYCAIDGQCNYFSFDGRVSNAENICYLLRDVGRVGAQRVCCNSATHYADEDRTVAGWISGLPPRTRHAEQNARVIIEPKNLLADPTNDYQTQFVLSLGSTPMRGAVWIEPTVASSTTTPGLSVAFSPPRVVLYDAETAATVNVTVSNIDPNIAKSTSIVVNNAIESCDVAFMMMSTADSCAGETAVYITVTVPQGYSRAFIAILVPLATVALVAILMFICSEYRRQRNDAVWKVNEKELVFGSPVEIVGRGTFGLVLLAEYRGTQVAVKRVLPPRSRKHEYESKFSSFRGKWRESPPCTVDDVMDASCLFLDDQSLAMSLPPKTTTCTRSSAASTQQTNVGMASGALRSLGGTGQGAEWRHLRSDFINEMRILSKLRHPCVTTVIGAVISSTVEPMLVMEYMDHGSLYDLLHNETVAIDGEIILPILRDIAQGMNFLHSSNIIHCDLKAANILVDRTFRAKVSDFGLSQKKRLISTGNTRGTPFWMAPEVLRGASKNTAASDVYSFGVTLYEVYSRRDPYEGEDPEEVLNLIIDRTIDKRPTIPPTCTKEVQCLMRDCLAAHPEGRPTFKELDQRMKLLDTHQVCTRAKNLQQHPSKPNSVSLFDIFPRHIAQALRDGQTVEPKHHEIVTVFFSDIVGFTNISASLDPYKVADLLSRLYAKFDELSLKHGVFKVETVGDAYMAVTNLVEEQPDDHAKRIAEFAIAAVQTANSTLIDAFDRKKGYVNIRVGIHSGSCVADVLGSCNPRYCLFGDTINTASRMESHSAANRIHCSERSAFLLKLQEPTIPVRPRGKISIKSKGKMFTYWVNEVCDKGIERVSQKVVRSPVVVEQEQHPGPQMVVASSTDVTLTVDEEQGESVVVFGASKDLALAKQDMQADQSEHSYNVGESS